MKIKKCVFPGDEVAVVEEFIPGEGTYEIDGKIYSAYCGHLILDHEEKVAKVSARNPPLTLKVGDVVYAEITDVKSTMAICEVIAVEGRDRNIAGDTNATIHVSKVSSGYIQDVGKEIRPSDVVRARVVQVKPSLQLSTIGHHFGVILALCRKCRMPLKKRDKKLYCERCERFEDRKVADDYGEVRF